jgi:hypothetical protein
LLDIAAAWLKLADKRAKELEAGRERKPEVSMKEAAS